MSGGQANWDGNEQESAGDTKHEAGLRSWIQALVNTNPVSFVPFVCVDESVSIVGVDSGSLAAIKKS